MCPLSYAERHDAPWLADELVPCMAADIDNVIIGAEDSLRQPCEGMEEALIGATVS